MEIAKRVAWRVFCHDVLTVTFAKTRSQAKANAFRAARDAGYRKFPSDLAAYRAPEYDASHLNDGRDRRACYSEYAVKTT